MQLQHPLLIRYENWFGEGSSKLLLKEQRLYSSHGYIRVNISKTTVKSIVEFFKNHRVHFSATPIDNCFKINKTFFNISSTLPALTGELYIQDFASQIPVCTIDFERLKDIANENGKVLCLDMAASPGSKTTQLADILSFYNIPYEIVALEPEQKRLTKLINNIQKQGFTNVKVIETRAENYSTTKQFDVILLDAPCSGNLITDNQWLNKRNLKGIQDNAQLQKTLFAKAVELLAPAGQLIYSTCSLEREENEENVEYFSRHHPVKAMPLKLKMEFDTKPLNTTHHCMRFTPHISHTQGFFIAKFEKRKG